MSDKMTNICLNIIIIVIIQFCYRLRRIAKQDLETALQKEEEIRSKLQKNKEKYSIATTFLPSIDGNNRRDLNSKGQPVVFDGGHITIGSTIDDNYTIRSTSEQQKRDRSQKKMKKTSKSPQSARASTKIRTSGKNAEAEADTDNTNHITLEDHFDRIAPMQPMHNQVNDNKRPQPNGRNLSQSKSNVVMQIDDDDNDTWSDDSIDLVNDKPDLNKIPNDIRNTNHSIRKYDIQQDNDNDANSVVSDLTKFPEDFSTKKKNAAEEKTIAASTISTMSSASKKKKNIWRKLKPIQLAPYVSVNGRKDHASLVEMR